MDLFKLNNKREKYTVIRPEHNKAVMELLTVEEKKIFSEFQSEVAKLYPGEEDDLFTLYRFLKGKKFKVKDALKQFTHRMRWIEETKPHQLTPNDCKNQIQKGKAFILGFDKKQRPILIIRGSNHSKGTAQETEELHKFIFLLAEVTVQLLPPPPYNNVIVLYDRAYYTRSNFDPSTIHFFAATTANYYPELLHTLYVLRPNFLFTILYNIAKALIDPATMEKFKIMNVTEEKMREHLKEIIPEETIPIDLGGKGAFPSYFPKETPEHFVRNFIKTNGVAIVSTPSTANLTEADIEQIEHEVQEVAEEEKGVDVLQDSSVDLD